MFRRGVRLIVEDDDRDPSIPTRMSIRTICRLPPSGTRADEVRTGTGRQCALEAAALGARSPVMRPGPDRVAGCTQQPQDQPNGHKDDADGPEDRDTEHEPEDQTDQTDGNHAPLVPAIPAPHTRDGTRAACLSNRKSSHRGAMFTAPH